MDDDDECQLPPGPAPDRRVAAARHRRPAPSPRAARLAAARAAGAARTGDRGRASRVDHPSPAPSATATSEPGAGGGLTAALALLARERGEVRPAFQLLTYPMLDDRTTADPSPIERDLRLWNTASNCFGWRSYLNAEPGGNDVSGLVAPARASDLSGLPPAWIGVGSLDLFRAEDAAYAERLRAAGVPCELLVVPGAFHGFDLVSPNAPISCSFRAAQVDALGRALADRPPATRS